VHITRPITLDDADDLARILEASRDFLAPFEPFRPEAFYTSAGQRAAIEDALTKREAGLLEPHVILNEQGEVAGRINLNDIVRGAFESCHLGYWLNEADTGKGLATRAVGRLIEVAFGDLRLHRIQAGTLVDNVASQRVLAKHGFTRFGLAPDYLLIAGRWQDHALFQLIRP
jgi:ribosomal-protein-alanine N-acetyltransferase